MGSLRCFKDPKYPFYKVNRCIGQNHASRKHVHDELAIALVTGGRSVFHFDGNEYSIHEGQLVMIGPGFVHRCCPESASEWRFYMLFVDPAWLDTIGLPGPDRPCFIVKDLETEAFQSLVLQFEGLCRAGENKEESLLYLVDQAFSDSEKSLLLLNTGGTEEDAADLISKYILSHLSEPVSLDELAELAGMNKFMMIRHFAQRFNTTPHAWQIIQRMNAARRYLEKNHSIVETAHELGFYDQSHFSRIFKESFGMTPRDFVGQHQIEARI